jgi:hypothetical protein
MSFTEYLGECPQRNVRNIYAHHKNMHNVSIALQNKHNARTTVPNTGIQMQAKKGCVITSHIRALLYI